MGMKKIKQINGMRIMQDSATQAYVVLSPADIFLYRSITLNDAEKWCMLHKEYLKQSAKNSPNL